VKLPQPPNPLLKICKALLAAEISIHYAYPLLVGPQGSAALALHVEDLEAAVTTLSRLGLILYTEKDLADEDGGLA
jgi:hypothetical protein